MPELLEENDIKVGNKSRLMIVPADAVIQRRRVLFNMTRRKGLVGGC
jgi:hypothetical protein